MRSRFCLKLRPETIEESIIHCLSFIGFRCGEDSRFPIETQLSLTDIAAALSTGKYDGGYLFSGRSGTGKTGIMLAVKEFLELLRKIPDSWEYPGINSIDSMYVRASDFCHPAISYEVFKDAAAIPVLFLDNLGYEIDGARATHTKEPVKELISARYYRRLITFIATPFDLQSIRETYGSHTASIIAENYYIVESERNPLKQVLCHET